MVLVEASRYNKRAKLLPLHPFSHFNRFSTDYWFLSFLQVACLPSNQTFYNALKPYPLVGICYQHHTVLLIMPLYNDYDFLLVRLSEAGVPITTDLKRSCSAHARLREKIPQALRARMIFSTNPKGLALLVRKEHRLLLPVVTGTWLRYAFHFPIYFYEIAAFFMMPFQKKKRYLCKRDKELFESMRNMAFINSSAFSYPLPVLVQVFYKKLIIK